MRNVLYTLMVAVALAFTSCQTSDQTSAEVEITPEFINSVRQFDDINEFSEGMAVVEKNGKFGFINTKGETVIPCKFYHAKSFNNGFAIVSDSLGYGAINRDGHIIVPCEYQEIRFNDGMFRLMKNDLYGFANEIGEVIIPCKYEHAGLFSDGLASVTPNRDNDKLIFINRKGETVLKGNYHANLPEFMGNANPDWTQNDGMPEFEYGICHLVEEEPEYKEYYIDTKGNEVDSNKAENIINQNRQEYVDIHARQGYIKFSEPINSYDIEPSEFVGLKDSLNNVVVPAKYTSIGEFKNGVAVAKISNVTDQYDYRGGTTIKGYVDTKGNTTFTDEDYKSFYSDRKKLAEEKEEKERLELEKARQEEERLNHPEIMFNQLLSTTAWSEHCPFYYGAIVRDYEIVLILRPQTNYSGYATIVAWIDDGRRSEFDPTFTTDKCVYTITGNVLDLKWTRHTHVGSKEMNWRYIIEYNDGQVTLRDTNNNHIAYPISQKRSLVPKRYKM